MKTKYLLLLGVVLVSKGALATTFEAKCLNQKSKFSSCKVTVGADSLSVEYKNKKEQELNVSVPGEKITSINAGELSKRNVAAGILLSPAFFLTKRKMAQVSLEYQIENNKTATVVFQVKEKYGFALKSQLQTLSGKVVQEEDKKTVEVGL